jgi:hypothetical protein
MASGTDAFETFGPRRRRGERGGWGNSGAFGEKPGVPRPFSSEREVRRERSRKGVYGEAAKKEIQTENQRFLTRKTGQSRVTC